MTLIKDILARFSSRKFILAIGAAITAYELAGTDGVYTVAETWAIITPLLAFIGAEGATDTLRASKPQTVEVSGEGDVHVEVPTQPSTPMYNVEEAEPGTTQFP